VKTRPEWPRSAANGKRSKPPVFTRHSPLALATTLSASSHAPPVSWSQERQTRCNRYRPRSLAALNVLCRLDGGRLQRLIKVRQVRSAPAKQVKQGKTKPDGRTTPINPFRFSGVLSLFDDKVGWLKPRENTLRIAPFLDLIGNPASAWGARRWFNLPASGNDPSEPQTVIAPGWRIPQWRREQRAPGHARLRSRLLPSKIAYN
jgi:hypothetical protein